MNNEGQNDFNMQQPVNAESNKKKTGIIIMIVIFLVIAIAGAYLLLRNYEETPEVEEKPKEKETIEISEAEVLVLLNEGIPFWAWDGIKPNVYIDRKVTFNDVHKTSVINFALAKLDESHLIRCSMDVNEAEVKQALGENYYIVLDNLAQAEYGEYCILLSDLQQVIKEKFNQDNFDVSSYFYIAGGSAVVYGGKIFLYHSRGGFGLNKEIVDFSFEVIDDEVHIKETMFIFGGDFVTISFYYNEMMRLIYTRTLDDERHEVYWINELKEMYGGEFKTYNHVFRQNSLGNWYWYSTEPTN